MKKNHKLTVAEKHVLYQFGHRKGTYGPGGFIASLINAIIKADTPNSRKLYLAFPEYVDAVRAVQTGKKLDGTPHDILPDYSPDDMLPHVVK